MSINTFIAILSLLLISCLSAAAPAVDYPFLSAEDINNHPIRATRKTAVFFYYNKELLASSDNLARHWAALNNYQAYKAVANDEFAWGDVKQAMAAQIDSQLESVSMRFVHSYPVYLGNYDSAKGGFPIKGGRKNDVIKQRIRGGDLRLASGNVPRPPKGDLGRPIAMHGAFVWFDLDRAVGIDFLSASRDDAKYLVQEMNQNNNKQRKVFIKVEFDVTGAEAKAGGGRATIHMPSKVISVKLQDKDQQTMADIFQAN